MLKYLASVNDEPFVPELIEFPCTISQRRHWMLDKARSGDPTLNIAARWRLEGPVVAALLEQSLQMVIDRHETLRTAFIERDDVPVQLVATHAPFSLRLIDLADLPEAERLAAATQQARDEASRPFDLTQAPLLRATLVRLQPALSELLVTTHHLVGDCWSNGILARETADTYEALYQHRVPVLAALALQFGDYARWHEAWIEQGGADQAEAYWDRRLAGLPSFHVPTDRALPPRSAGAGDIMGMPVPKLLAEAAQELARANGATFFMLGVATMATVLHCWTGAAEVVFGTQVAGRNEVELEELVGSFVNTVALRIDVGAAVSFVSLLDDVRQIVGEALEHGAAPIERIVRQQDANGARRDPLTAVNFLIQRAFTRDSDHGSVAFKGVPNLSPGSRYDLNVFLVERPSGWRASCEFDPELFDRARIDWLLRSFLHVLGVVLHDPGCRIASVTLADDPPIPLGNAGPDKLPDQLSDVEGRLAALWAKVLRRETVPGDANFFRLGGDSIRAAQLLALTRQTFGRSMSLGQLFKAPTIAGMTALLRDDLPAPPAGVVWVQPHGSQPPIFAINNTGIFYTLAHHLGADQPFAAVQALDPDISPSLHPSDLRTIASRYVALIRQVRPQGPYALIGLCAAGKVAFEAARQLTEAGETVRLLAVVDSWAPGHFRRMTGWHRMRARISVRAIRFSRQIRRIREGTLSLHGFLANRALVRIVRNDVFELLRRVGGRDSVPPGVQNNLFVNHLDAAARRHVSRPYPGDMLVFHGPEQPYGHNLDPNFGWEELATGRVDVVFVPADRDTAFTDHHQGLFQDPGARVMADAILSALHLQGEGRSSTDASILAQPL